MSSFTSFEQLECWKACREVVKWVRISVSKLPAREFDLKDNISRAARSTTRNIAEGFGRYHFQENIQFCRISRGSLFEIIDDMITMKEENFISEGEFTIGRSKVDFAIKLLNGYIQFLQRQNDLKSQRPAQ
ncbi:four helix bundle protein [Flavisolibacter sp. BT320]|nr:four helix bundle protein [Flavisolibacter longurius]